MWSTVYWHTKQALYTYIYVSINCVTTPKLPYFKTLGGWVFFLASIEAYYCHSSNWIACYDSNSRKSILSTSALGSLARLKQFVSLEICNRSCCSRLKLKQIWEGENWIFSTALSLFQVLFLVLAQNIRSPYCTLGLKKYQKITLVIKLPCNMQKRIWVFVKCPKKIIWWNFANFGPVWHTLALLFSIFIKLW